MQGKILKLRQEKSLTVDPQLPKSF